MEFQIGMNEVYSPLPDKKPVANVVLVHGLFGGPWKTWAAKCKSSRSGPMIVEGPASSASSMDAPPQYKETPSKHIFWPETLLPSVVENVKVYSFGYDADVERFMSSAGLNTVHQHGRNLFNELHALRKSQIPTIIVAHSLGGLVVKEALNQAAHSAQKDEREVVSNTSGVIFLGTPHRGSDAASYGRVAYMLTKAFAFQSANTKLLTALEKNSETLDRISTEFFQTLEKYSNLRIASFSEEKQVRFGVFGMQIVRPDSAKIGHAHETWGSISEDHRNMAKYRTTRDDGFVKVSRKINHWIDEFQRQMSSGDLKLYEDCLSSLNEPVARFRVQEVDPVRHYNEKTFEWLFTDKVAFSRWLRDDHGEFDAIFWITGKPGSGKSTLMRFALEDSRTMSLQPSASEGHPMAYFFHLRGKSLIQKSLIGMLKELVYQLLERYPNSFELIRPIFLNLRRLKQEWDIRSLSQAMLTIPHLPPAAPGSRDHITLFVDALDENQNQDENITLLSLFENLNDTYMGVRGKPDVPVLKICLASRPWPIFRKQLGDKARVPSLAIHDFTVHDIQHFTNTHIVKALEKREKVISQLSTDIASRAQGVFIWVRVVVDNLRQEILDGTPLEALQKILRQYPMELDDMYKLTLKRIAPAYRSEALILFKTVLASRVPLTAVGAYAVTCICLGNPPPADGPTESLDDITSWLASRSGGLIDTVGTGASKECAVVVSEGGSEAKGVRSASKLPAGSDLQIEFLHQTVQDFVRNSLDETLDVAEKSSSVAQLSGSRLLALACVDRHPPHLHLQSVAKGIFDYIREVEREEDNTKLQQITSLPHWGSYDLHKFPFRLRDHGNPDSVDAQATSESVFYYLDPHSRQARMSLAQLEVLTKADDIYSEWISNYTTPILVSILHNLYRTDGRSENVFALRARYARNICDFVLFSASVGPRLSKESVDRPRMFQHILDTFVAPLWDIFSSGWEGFDRQFPGWLSYRPVTEIIDHVSTSHLPGDLICLFACLKPNTEVNDKSLLAFAQGLEQYQTRALLKPIVLKIPVSSIPEDEDDLGSPKRQAIPAIRMSPVEFCSRFRETNRSKWVDLFLRCEGNSYIPPPEVVESQRFVDLALYDAANQQPPEHVYTKLASLDGWEAERQGAVTGQVIASACFPAAVVGIGSRRVFRAFFQLDNNRFVR